MSVLDSAIVALTGTQVCRSGVEGALVHSVNELLAYDKRSTAEQSEESLAELGRHEVVQNGIHGGVQVQHDPAEVQNVVVLLDSQCKNIFLGCDYDPQSEPAKRQQAHEETDHDRGQHENDLFAILQNIAAVSVRDYSRIVHQVLRNDAVQDQQDEERYEEEQRNAADEEEHTPKRVHRGQAYKHIRFVHVFYLVEGSDRQHRTETGRRRWESELQIKCTHKRNLIAVFTRLT